MNEGYDFVKSVVEALLFISEKPVTLDQLHEVLEELSPAEIRRAVFALKDEYEEARRGVVVLEVAGGYQMLSSPQYTDAVRRFFKKRVREKLSSPALETLAIVAYKQPVSRADIELIRGVNSDGVVAHLLSKGLIKVAGRKDVPGKPYIYGTTKQFLEYFGLKSLNDLPKLEEFPSLFSKNEERQTEMRADGLLAPSDAGDEVPAPQAETAALEPADATEAENLTEDIPAQGPPETLSVAHCSEAIQDREPEQAQFLDITAGGSRPQEPAKNRSSSSGPQAGESETDETRALAFGESLPDQETVMSYERESA